MSDSTVPPDGQPDDAWYDGDLTPEAFRALGYRVIDGIADYLRDIRAASPDI